MNDGAAAEEAAQTVLQLPRRQRCYGCVPARHRTNRKTVLGTVTLLTYS